jgi:hypothetical protein
MWPITPITDLCQRPEFAYRSEPIRALFSFTRNVNSTFSDTAAFGTSQDRDMQKSLYRTDAEPYRGRPVVLCGTLHDADLARTLREDC